MKRLAVCALAACAPDTVAPWELDYDRIVAVRATPPHLRAGEVAQLDALIASAGEPVTEQSPARASAVGAAAGLFTAVRFNLDHWEINAPDEAQLDAARAELGLADEAPVPLPLTLRFGSALYAEKLVWLGDAHDNPPPPSILVDGTEHTDTVDAIELPLSQDVRLEIAEGSNYRVRWLTSCGDLVDDGAAQARIRSDRACAGELTVVVRDDLGGVTWRVLPIVAR